MEKIVLEGVVGWEFGYNALQMLPKGGDLRVYIHSPGGDVVSGQALAGALRLHAMEHGATVETVGVGLVASIATMILLAGTRASMDSGAFFMIHNSSGGAWGGADAMRSTAEALDTIDATLLTTYVNKIKKSGKYEKGTEAKVKEMMDNETWLTAKQAFKLGLIDEVIEEAQQAPPADKQGILAQLEKFKNAPRALVAMYSPPVPSADPAPADAPPAADSVPAPETVSVEPKYQNQSKMKDERKGFWASFLAFLTGSDNAPAPVAPDAPPVASVETAAPEAAPVAAVPPVVTADPVPAPEFAALAKLQADLDALKKQNEALTASLDAEKAKKGAAPLTPTAPVAQKSEMPKGELAEFVAKYENFFK